MSRLIGACARIGLAAVVVLAVGARGDAAPTARPETAAPAGLVAVSPPDDDLHPDAMTAGTPSDVPPAVARTCRELATAALARWDATCEGSDACRMPLASFIGPIVRLRAPAGRVLFVFVQANPLGASFYHFILFEKRTGSATRQPPAIYAKWMEGDWGARLEKPLVAFRDLDGDGSPELVTEERVHNGTMYNAIVYHYFQIAPDLALRRLLALETRLVDLRTEAAGGIIERSLHTLSPLRLRVRSELRRAGAGAPPVRLGEVTLGRIDREAPFQVVKRRVFAPAYGDLLVTAFGMEAENDMLAEGYRFHY